MVNNFTYLLKDCAQEGLKIVETLLMRIKVHSQRIIVEKESGLKNNNIYFQFVDNSSKIFAKSNKNIYSKSDSCSKSNVTYQCVDDFSYLITNSEIASSQESQQNKASVFHFSFVLSVLRLHCVVKILYLHVLYIACREFDCL